MANQQGLPLVVAAFVLRSHTYPTARRYQFWLQGFCDTQLELLRAGQSPASSSFSPSLSGKISSQ